MICFSQDHPVVFNGHSHSLRELLVAGDMPGFSAWLDENSEVETIAPAGDTLFPVATFVGLTTRMPHVEEAFALLAGKAPHSFPPPGKALKALLDADRIPACLWLLDHYPFPSQDSQALAWGGLFQRRATPEQRLRLCQHAPDAWACAIVIAQRLGLCLSVGVDESLWDEMQSVGEVLIGRVPFTAEVSHAVARTFARVLKDVHTPDEDRRGAIHAPSLGAHQSAGRLDLATVLADLEELEQAPFAADVLACFLASSAPDASSRPKARL